MKPVDIVTGRHLDFKKWSPLLYNLAYFRIYLQQVNQNWHTYTLRYMDSYEIGTDVIPARHLEFEKGRPECL